MIEERFFIRVRELNFNFSPELLTPAERTFGIKFASGKKCTDFCQKN
jgi:hypothetical protein